VSATQSRYSSAVQPSAPGALCSIENAHRTVGAEHAPLAQTAERLHGKEKVYGSIP
jgi:hypothetical protein